MLRFRLNPEKRSVLISNGIILLIAFIGYAKYEFRPENPTLISRFIVKTVAPMQAFATRARMSVSNFYDHYLDVVNTSKENEYLRAKVAELSQDVFQINTLKAENTRLKQLLSFGENTVHKKVLGQVIGWDASSEYKILRIDKGSEDGVVVKSAVITADGLVGHTYRVYEKYSDVLTILDTNNRVDVVSERTRTHGIVEGLSVMTCRMKYVPHSEELFIGDEVVTAGLSIIYPKGLRVGQIINIKKSPEDLTQELTVKPVVDFTKLEEVVVLISPASEMLEKMESHPVGEEITK